jgi:hypothetical protein
MVGGLQTANNKQMDAPLRSGLRQIAAGLVVGRFMSLSAGIPRQITGGYFTICQTNPAVIFLLFVHLSAGSPFGKPKSIQ